jgi:hypothetical protein
LAYGQNLPIQYGKTRYAARTAGTLVFYGQEQYKCTGILFKIYMNLQCNMTVLGT